jgi:hypothetical protein
MIVTYDWEFLDDGRTVEPISIGMVAADGREFYAVNGDADYERICLYDEQHNGLWLHTNVLSHLPDLGGGGPFADFELDYDSDEVFTRDAIAVEVEAFLRATPDVELWADHPATDHVALYQLFGPMIECTSHGMPMRTNCLEQERVQVIRRGLLSHDWAFPEQLAATKHHALHDARHNMTCAERLGLLHLPFPWVTA